MRKKALRSCIAGGAAASLAAVMLVQAGSAATADTVPGFASDIGVYTDGQTDSVDIGDPVFTGVEAVEAALDHGVPYTAGNMHESIFDADLEAGGTDYYLDRILGVAGTTGNNVLQTRGRTLYMRGGTDANFSTMGFAGNAHAGGPNNLGDLYTITVPDHEVSEIGDERFNAPSHAKAGYSVGDTGVHAALTKFITDDNVAVTTLNLNNPGDAAVTFTLDATAPLARTPGEDDDELMGTRTLTSGSNNGLRDTAWSSVTLGLKAEGFTRVGTSLQREVTLEPGESQELSVVGVLHSATHDGAEESFREYAEMAPADAFREAVTAFNRQWAHDVPYIDVPDPAIEKAIVYRWWGERYNTLDANEPGYVYQYPTTIEGIHLYQNSIVLTQPMHLQDTKWLRTPYLPYGQVMNVGELSGSSAFLDSPGHTSWNNHYSQYLGTAGLEAYNVHGGGPEIAERFAHYFEGDGTGQLEHYDGDDTNLIAYDTNYMPGNDADAIAFGYPRTNQSEPGARTIERPESAYVWGAFTAAAALYEIAGAGEEKVSELTTQADDIRDAILDTMWSDEMQMFLAATTHGAEAAATSGDAENPLSEDERHLIPAKESNLYNIYSENLIPEDDWEQYVDGFRFLRYGDNFPIFPFYTADQYDRDKFEIGGSNNFSNINFTVQYRAIRAALRHYDPENEYITEEYAQKLLDWMAWSVYPEGDLRAPNQAEYYSNWDPETLTYNRNNPNHVMLGNMNYIYVEDMGGIQPRSDELVELSPIDLGYDHFMVNNLRYHGSDLTIVWDADGSHYGLGQGYSLFIDGERAAAADELGRFVYDPTTNEIVESDEGLSVEAVAADSLDFATAVETGIDDARVVDYLRTAGIDLEEDADNLALTAELSSSEMQEGARPTPWAEFHTPGWSETSMNYTPGAIDTTERPVSLDALTDGVTINEPYWGNYGADGDEGWIELEFGEPVDVDNVKMFFVSDRQEGGYSQPSHYSIQVPDGDGWATIPDQYKAPKIPTAKFNEALFETVTTDRIRVAFTNQKDRSTAISEIQVFDSGRDVPEVVNDPPVVTAAVDEARQGNLSAGIVATVVDDGLPEGGELTHGWDVVSAPDGADAIIGDAGALSTTVTGTVEGSYVLRFWAEDGELRSERDVEVALSESEATAEFGSSAAIRSSGAASWEDESRVNHESDPESSNPGAGEGWGNWGQPNSGASPEQAAWLEYSWDAPVTLTSSDIYWYDDTGGTRMPAADGYEIQYSSDGETWESVTLTGDASYADALERDTYNRLEFEPFDASRVRILITGLQGDAGGTGVLRWRVYGDTVEEVASPVIIRTETGVVPELPETLDVTFAEGARGEIAIDWQEITDDMVAETNVDPFVVYGTNAAYGVLAEARIYVRPEMSEGGISIQGAEQFERTVIVGEQPHLPTRVEVSYNDGSRDNQAIGVEWDLDEAVLQEAGTYEIHGDLVLPWYVSTAGTTATTLTLTVVEDGEEPDPTPTLDVAISTDLRCVAGRAGLGVRVTNENDVPIDAAVATPLGDHEFAGIEPEANGFHAFMTRGGALEAGTVTVTVTAGSDGETLTEEFDVEYGAESCE